MNHAASPLIVVCGEALVDLFVRAEADGALDVSARLAGAPFNLAIGLARLGGRSALAAGLSTDLFGQSFRRHLEAEKVEGDFIEIYEAPTNLVIVGRNAKGDPTYDFPIKDSADCKLNLQHLSDTSLPIAAITFGSYLMAFPESQQALLSVLRQRQIQSLICLDPNIRLGMISDPLVWRHAFELFVPLCDIIKASEEDIEAIYPEKDHDQVAKNVLDQGPKLFIMTRGKKDVSAWQYNGTKLTSESQKIDVKDTVGAGDSFFAALLIQLQQCGALEKQGLATLSKENLLAALDFANRAAAITCSRLGADLPRKGEIADNLSTNRL
ncbi:MAG: carbohydrate kinase [Alphaproteobacteria bacterium]|nr:carbohydrate kinase [Alphaproteobacteria bacterium]